MSMTPLGGLLRSAAGAPLSQTKGSESDRSSRESSAIARAVKTADHADRAGGISETQQDQQSEDRDADGRRLWEAPVATDSAETVEAGEPTRSKDATGIAGNQLDLVG